MEKVTRRSRRLSRNMNSLEPQSRSKEENLEQMIQDLHCPQCHRTFKDQAQAKDEKENKHHFCYVIGNLKTSLQVDPTPTLTKKAKLCCSFCSKSKNIVFSNQRELMKHLVLAHKTKFFIEEIQKQNMRKGLAKEDLRCFHSNCKVKSRSQEDHLIHVGLDHEKLFNALMHDKKNNLKNVAKNLFPKKFQKHSHDWSRGSAGSSEDVKPVKRSLSRADEGEGSPAKKAKSEDQKVAMSQSSITHRKTATKPITTQDSPIPASSSSEAKPRRMKRETCVVCGDTQSNKVTLYNHLAAEHFYQEITRKYPGTASDRDDHFPCGFPGCSEVFSSALARVRHLGGRKHGEVDQCLAAMKAAKTDGGRRMEDDTEMEGGQRRGQTM